VFGSVFLDRATLLNSEPGSRIPESNGFTADMKRREFIVLTSAGATGATLLSACGHPETKLIRALVPDEEYVPGTDYWKASTCSMCDAGCGIVVRTREHNANKIEGNPSHPVNRGALCARGQAGLQLLYNPDRIKAPLKRTGDRASDQFEEISWDEAIKLLADKLREIKSHGDAARVVFATGEREGVTGLAAEHLMSGYGSPLLASINRESEAPTRQSYADSYGSERPVFDIANASYLLSFGARFLETWHSPVMYSLAYGEFRRAKNRARGRFVQVEPRMSLTAANADEWLPAAVGTEGLVALSIAQVITREALIKGAAMPASMTSSLSEPLDTYAPEQTADRTGIPAEKIIRIAREMAASEHPLVICGGAAAAVPGAAENLRAINLLNIILGNLNKAGGVMLPAAPEFDPLEKLRTKAAATWVRGWASVASTPPSAVLIHSANPAYGEPTTFEQIKRAQFIVSFSTFLDETARVADLILPDNSYLERWDVKAARTDPKRSVAVTRPVVKQTLASRQTADVLIAVSRELGAAPTFESAEDIVKQIAGELSKQPGSIKSDDPDEFLKALLDQGIWIGEGESASHDSKAGSSGSSKSGGSVSTSATKPPQAQSSGGGEYPLTLLPYEHAALGVGEQANLPSLQELPDPMTSVMWGSWVEINPTTATSLGVADGDTVEISSEHGSIRAPAVIYPAIRPDVVAMALGQGHSAYGRYAAGRGANPAEVVGASGTEPRTVPVRISRVSGNARLIRFGTDLWDKMEKKR
jgi:anaerobic selenocysteine-containing dehydrogenase